MQEEYYLIKEAAAKVGVESHVLRYWEEELKMAIRRNEMGHRYYTERDIEIFSRVRDLKEKGLQLKAIRSYLEKRREQLAGSEQTADIVETVSGEDGQRTEADRQDAGNQETAEAGKQSEVHRPVTVELRKQDAGNQVTAEAGKQPEPEGKGSPADKPEKGGELVPARSGVLSNEEKLEQFQQIMNRILSSAIQENHELIGETAGRHAADAVVATLQGMTKEQEAKVEARYQKLDQTLREIQRARQEAAAANMRPVDRRRQKRLKRKNAQSFYEDASE